jgi:hypothetical protein
MLKSRRTINFLVLAVSLSLIGCPHSFGQTTTQQGPAMGNRIGDITGNQGIITQGQIGNNTINQAPEPDLKTISTNTTKNADGSQTLQALVEVVAPYPPGQLYLSATAPEIIDFSVNMQRVGIQQTGHSGTRDGMRFTTLVSPFGQYMVTIRTSGAAQVLMEYRFN